MKKPAKTPIALSDGADDQAAVEPKVGQIIETDSDLTEIAAIVDRSGSMWKIKTETEQAFDGYVADQRGQDGRANLTLVQFDTKIETDYRSKPLIAVPPLHLQPRGLTALYDAIGITIVDLGTRIAKLERRPGKVVVVILTDGEENSSKEWTADMLKRAVQARKNEGWTFIYLGANQDAVFEGSKIGIDADSSLTFDIGNVGTASHLASTATSQVRSTGKFTGYTKAQRESAAKPKELGA